MKRWLEKQRRIASFTISSLIRRRSKNIALILMYSLVVFGLGSVMLFSEALKREASLLLRDNREILVQRMVAGRHEYIPVEYAESIKTIRGVQSASGRLWGYCTDPVTGNLVCFIVSHQVPSGSSRVILGEQLARDRRVSVGELISYTSWDGRNVGFTVAAVEPSESSLESSAKVQVGEEEFRNFFGIPAGVATDLAVHVRNPKELTTISGKIQAALPDTRPVLREEMSRTYDAVFGWRSGVIILTMVLGVMAFIIYAWDKAAGLSAEEKREIGILKAVGWETSDVLQMKFWEGSSVSLTSFVIGVILAHTHVLLSSGSIFGPFLKGWSILYPEFRLFPQVDAYQISTLFFLTVIPYTVATIIPSWRAATIDPDSAVR